MTDVDPNAPARPESGLFGLENALENARVHVIPAPFDATTSYRRGAARGPEAILRASHQVDLLDLDFGSPWKAGIAMLEADPRFAEWNAEATALADRLREHELSGDAEGLADLERLNAIGAGVNGVVREATERALDAGKLPVVLGGDHAVPFGAWQAAAERFPGLGLLHFDAHADLRARYEGFHWSHASILFNALELDGLGRVVQVGIRDVCDEELACIADDGRVETLFDRDWAAAKLRGRDLSELVQAHLAHLPDDVWITFDVDGLDPSMCPNTGTPVPGGLDWHETSLWLVELARSGRRIVGADLVEVAPGTERPPGEGWDEIVGARLLYRLIGTALARS